MKLGTVHQFLLFAASLILPAAPTPREPIYEKHLTGIPIKGWHFPIGPGTDRGLYNNLYEGDIVYDPNDVRNAVVSPALLWPSGAVIYKVDDDIGCPDSPQCKILMRAMDHYHARSCIRFKEWSGEENFIRIFFNSKESGACWSPVGRAGNGEQKLSLGHRCWYLGIVVHELGHAIGFWHEMNRPDRDEWIQIFWSNILPGYVSAFDKQDANTVNTLGESFDYSSVMMYDEYAFSKDGKSPTLQSKRGNEVGPIWKKGGLSDSDLRRLHKLYKCRGNTPKEGFPYNAVCNFNLHTCGFKNGGAAVWNWRTVNNTDGYVYSSYEVSGTTPGFLMSVNFHESVSPGSNSLGCVRFWYLIQQDTIAHLKLSQAYLDKVTQLDNDPEATYELWFNDTSNGQWVHVAVPLYVTKPFIFCQTANPVASECQMGSSDRSEYSIGNHLSHIGYYLEARKEHPVLGNSNRLIDEHFSEKLIFESEFSNENKDGTIALDDVEMLYRECKAEGISGMAHAQTADSGETSDRPLETTPSPSRTIKLKGKS